MSHWSKSPAARTWPDALRDTFSYIYIKYNIIYIHISTHCDGMKCDVVSVRCNKQRKSSMLD